MASLSGRGGASAQLGRATAWMAWALSQASMNVRSRSLRKANHRSRSVAKDIRRP